MPRSGAQLHHILLLCLVLPPSALGHPAQVHHLRRDDSGSGDGNNNNNNNNISPPPRRSTANDIVAAFLSLIAIILIALWVLDRLVSVATVQLKDMAYIASETGSSSGDSR